MAFTLCALFFGTGIAYYAIIMPSLSHVYSFGLISCFIHQAYQYFAQQDFKALLRAAALLGLVVLVRPVNAIVLLSVPAIGLLHPKKSRELLRILNWRWLFVAIAITVSIVAIQPLLWYWQSGVWWVRPYAGEGFNWTAPELWKSAMGAQKGLFFHWPVLLLAAPGLVLLFSRQRRSALLLTMYFVLLFWITSAWWNWLYGDSYGLRPYLDHLVVFAWVIAVLFDALSSTQQRWAVVIIAPFLALQTFHAWQYQAGLIHPYNMDLEKWRFIQFRSDPGLNGMLGGNYEPAPYAPNGLLRADSTALLETHWIGVDSMLRVAFNPPMGRELYIEMELHRRALALGATRDARVECLLVDADSVRTTYGFRMNDQPMPDDRQWRHWRYAFRMPATKHREQLVIQIRQPSPGTFAVRNIRVRIRAVEPY